MFEEGVAVQRLFSTFARGWPGAGLLILRLSASITAFHQCGEPLALNHSLFKTFAASATVLLISAGLWTPIAGGMLVVLAIWTAVSRTEDPWTLVLLAAVGIALTMLGPGAWSIDARLFGRRRLRLKR